MKIALFAIAYYYFYFYGFDKVKAICAANN